MQITRQHETTTIEELCNSECTSLLGIGPGSEQGYYAWYLEAKQTWYRFFIHLGILFWTTAAPDADDDLAEGETYHVVVDLTWPSKERTIEKIEMQGGILTISFYGNRTMIVKENEEAVMTITVS